MIYMIEERTPPRALANKNVAFRNRVIHQGLIPSLKDTVEFGQIVVNTINEALNTLKTKSPDLLQDLCMKDLSEKARLKKSGKSPTTMSIPTLYDATTSQKECQKLVEDWVDHTKSMRTIWTQSNPALDKTTKA